MNDYAEVVDGCQITDHARKDEEWGMRNATDLCSGNCYGCPFFYWKVKA